MSVFRLGALPAFDRPAGPCKVGRRETPFDAERKREILLALRDLKCDRLPKEVEVARKRYARHPKVLKVLEQAKEYSW